MFDTIRGINWKIARGHLFSRKRQTFTAVLGVAIGISVYLFMNSLSSGFTDFSRKEIFKNNAHLKAYYSDRMSEVFSKYTHDSAMNVIINPRIIDRKRKLVDVNKIKNQLSSFDYVQNVLPQVNVDVIYQNGESNLSGFVYGANILELDRMFGLKKYIIAGSIEKMSVSNDGIVIGKGIAEKLNYKLGDNILVKSFSGVSLYLEVLAIFDTGSSALDKSKSYVTLSTARKLLQSSSDYVSAIYINVDNPDNAVDYSVELEGYFDFDVEPWQETNSDILSGDLVRSLMMNLISVAILVVASFGIYNILNITVMQKINDIAILKAVGFNSKDVVAIFILEAGLMGLMGAVLGLCLGSIIIGLVSGVYLGGPVGYFPIYFDFFIYFRTFLLGILLIVSAGYFPARKASKIDPISIFRR